MANDDLLQQFKELLAENNKQLRQEVREDNKAEFDSLHDRLDAQREHINTVEKNLKLEIKESEKNVTATVRQETGMLADLIVEHDTQIDELQKAVGLRPKH